MSALEAKVLRRTAEIVEQGWCQHALAKRADGGGLSLSGSPGSTLDDYAERLVRHPEAGQWCAVGARRLACIELDAPRYTGAIAVGSIVAFNNALGRTAEEVAAVLREAAARVEEAVG